MNELAPTFYEEPDVIVFVKNEQKKGVGGWGDLFSFKKPGQEGWGNKVAILFTQDEDQTNWLCSFLECRTHDLGSHQRVRVLSFWGVFFSVCS